MVQLSLTRCTTYTLPKSCINVERLCELGVSLDMNTAKGVTNVQMNNFGANDGLITKREIEDEYSRQLFSTLNQKPLIVSEENPNSFTGYYNYPIQYTCPTDFDGKMAGFINNFTNGYSFDDEAWNTNRLDLVTMENIFSIKKMKKKTIIHIHTCL